MSTMDSDNSIVSILFSISLPEVSHITFTHGYADPEADVFKEASVFLPVTRSWMVTASSELTVW